MIRIDPLTVDLTVPEQAASSLFESYLDIGYGIADAVARVRSTFEVFVATVTNDGADASSFVLSDEFWAYLAG